MNALAKWMLVAAMTGLGSAPVAADTLFDVTGTFADGGGSLGGQIMIDTVAGSLDSGTLTISGESPDYSGYDGTYSYVGYCYFGCVPGNRQYSPGIEELAMSRNGGPAGIFLFVTGTSLVGYSGGSILVTPEVEGGGSSAQCPDYECLNEGSMFGAPGYDPLSAGKITAVPLPASMWLMLSGLGGLVVLRGRRPQRLAA
jgi:hypothetical protein